jgi:phospholipid-binding lipoprotein MlaA
MTREGRLPIRIAAAWLLAAVAFGMLGGCATAHDPRDPLEPMNRAIYKFNDAADKVAIKPIAKGYVTVVPPPIRMGVSNFFGNFRDVTTAVNGLLQGKLKQAASDVGRIGFNTTMGLLGIFDVSTRLGFPKHDEDFGQTLGYWGVKDGPYLVLPFLGPSNLRDAVGLIPDFYLTDPQFYVFHTGPGSWIALGVRYVNARANLLEAEKVFREAAFDEYSFLRDAYLQHRRSVIFDGTLREGETPRGPKRKTLKEMEEELELDSPPAAPDGKGSEP